MITQRLCVFCGSKSGSSQVYEQAAMRLAQLMADRKIGLVYGGGSVGIMGIIANAMLNYGGEVIGVIPRALFKTEEGHEGITHLHVVTTMHERKARMAELSDGFIALPGGIGTLEEFFEVWTWAMLGIHAKPFGLLNVSGYFDQLLSFLDHAVDQQFVHDAHRAMLVVESHPQILLKRLVSYQVPRVDRLLSLKET